MSVLFKSGATSVYLQNPDHQNEVEIDKRQHIGESASGTRYRYDRGVQFKTLRLQWSELRESEKTALEGFYDTTVDGVMTQFEYTDHRGTKWNAYFTSPTLSFTEMDDRRASTTTFASGGVSYPTTVRAHGVWSTEVELEVEVPT